MTEIEEILIDFQAMGISSSAIERAFDLKIGDINRANLIDDPEVLALLRIAQTYPWLLEVAQNRYDEDKSKRIMLHNAVDSIMNIEHNIEHNKKLKKE